MLHQLSELECLTHLSITLTDPEPEHTMPEQPNAGNQGDDSDEEEDQVQEVQPEDSSTDKTGLVTAGLGALGHLRSLEINGPRTRPNSELCEEIAQLKGLTSLSLNMRGPFTGPGEVNWWYTGGDISPILEECSNLKRLQISSLARDGLDSILQTSQGLEQLIVSQTCQSTTNLQNRIHSLRSLQIGDVQLGSVCKQSGKMLAHMPLHDLQEPLQIGTLRVRVPNSEDVHYIQAEAQLTRIKAEARALADHYKATRAGKVLRVAPTMLAHYPVCVSARDYSAADLAAALAPLAPYVSVLALNEMHDDVARGAAIVQALGSDAHYVGLRVPQLGNLQGTLASLCPGTQELYVFGMGQQQQPQQQHVSGASSRTEASCASPDFGRTDMSVSGAGAGAVPPAAGATGLVAPAALQATDSPMLGLGADAGAAGSSDGLQASAAGMDVDATPVTASAAAAPQPFRLAPGEHPLTSHPLTSLTNTPSSHPLAPELTQSPPQSEASPTAAAPAAAPGASGSNDPTTSLTLDQLCTTSTPVSPWYSPAPPSFPGPTAAPGSAPAARSAPAPAAWSNQAPTGPLATVQPITTQPALTQHPAECATTSSPVSTPSAPAAPQPHLDSPGNAQILAKVSTEARSHQSWQCCVSKLRMPVIHAVPVHSACLARIVPAAEDVVDMGHVGRVGLACWLNNVCDSSCRIRHCRFLSRPTPHLRVEFALECCLYAALHSVISMSLPLLSYVPAGVRQPAALEVRACGPGLEGG